MAFAPRLTFHGIPANVLVKRFIIVAKLFSERFASIRRFRDVSNQFDMFY